MKIGIIFTADINHGIAVQGIHTVGLVQHCKRPSAAVRAWCISKDIYFNVDIERLVSEGKRKFSKRKTVLGLMSVVTAD